MADGSSNAVLVREYYAPVMLGTILATFLFGVNTSQSVTYLNYRRNDPWLTQYVSCSFPSSRCADGAMQGHGGRLAHDVRAASWLQLVHALVLQR